ncbi:MAG: autotransporter outer membrane beta-barrel domain-containing protein [Nitrospira sp. SB0678_bin_10]|nr:autotransporter outer membrane beta-barrel domain-containing protein [Nitrospira sp. SB0678_bin_10]
MKTGIYLFLVGGLLVLAGVFSDARPALAQEACPHPPGVTLPPDPPVTAQQVENGSATQGQFALAVRAQFKSQGSETVSAEQLAFAGCRLRLEGGPMRSGSTYIVTLTPDGRVFLHAKDMSLSAGSLKPAIYAGILSALGVPGTVLAGLASPDPAIGNRARSALLQLLEREPHAEFDLTSAVPGVRPGIPGASGYAAAYVSANTEQPRLLLAGFDLDASHLRDEVIDYGNPAITARDVVDRATLKQFVTEALRFLGGALRSARTTAESRAAFAKARLALRDPNGPWRHGSVYLYLLDRTSNIIVVHGAFPDQFELRPLVPTVRDVVTGKLVLPQVLEAASSSPEGGFVEYYFDDPDDDTDSADIPKLGYAREFTRTTSAADGTEISTHLVIGSGVYLRASEPVARQTNAVKAVLPQVMRAMTASTVDAVSGRIQQATAGTPPAKGFSLGGASTLADALQANGRALGNGTFDFSQLLANSSFTLPLNAAGTGGSGPLGNLTLWGSGDYRNFAGGNSNTIDYDGDVVSANLGVDTKLSADLLAGVSVGWARGAVDYSASGATGESTTTLTSINPYVGWQAPSGLNLWATAGYGWGEVEIDEQAADAQASDLSQQMVAAGVNGPLVSSDQVIPGGTTSLRLKGETAFTWADIEGAGSIEAVNLNASRQRLMFEGVHAHKLASGATLTPSVEMGMRYDGGDGDTGHSLEIGGGLRYADPATGLTVEGRARTVPIHSGDYREWGVSGLVRLDPGASGLGLALSVQPAWGQTASGVQRLWETGMSQGAVSANQAAGRVNARLAYGIGTTWGGQGVLTPYTDVSLSGEGARRLSLGGQFHIGTSVRMSLEGVESRPVRGLTNHGVMLRSDLTW